MVGSDIRKTSSLVGVHAIKPYGGLHAIVPCSPLIPNPRVWLRPHHRCSAPAFRAVCWLQTPLVR